MSTRLLAVYLALLIAGCGGSPPSKPASQPAPVDPLGAGLHTFTTGDGNRLPYVIDGAGETTVLLVHCWMCDRSFWSAQLPVLAARYRTLALDLPGHGEATAARDSWTVAGYAEDVAALIRELGLSDVILVGHSMGGPIALRTAALVPGRVRGIVGVDTLHDAEFEFAGDEIEGFLRAFEADYVGTCESFVQQMFPEEGVETIITHVRATSCDGERRAIGTALMRDFGSIDMERWFTEAGVPIRVINAAAPNPTRTESNRKYADFDAVLMQEVGHYPQMTRPELFNPLLVEILAAL
jgi:pimeloyl-ACP methyl ester carboxylesterase